MKYKLKHPIKGFDGTINEVSLKGDVCMEDILSAHLQAKDKTDKHNEIYLVFRMWGLDVSEGERLHFSDYHEMDRLLGKSMAPSLRTGAESQHSDR